MYSPSHSGYPPSPTHRDVLRLSKNTRKLSRFVHDLNLFSMSPRLCQTPQQSTLLPDALLMRRELQGWRIAALIRGGNVAGRMWGCAGEMGEHTDGVYITALGLR